MKVQKDNSIYFLKPFEIYSTYTPMIDTWKMLSKKLKNISELKEAYLLRAVCSDTKFGFISMSLWESKEAFLKSLSNDTLLKMHHSPNGEGNASLTRNLYKIIFSENNAVKVRKKRKSIMFFFNSAESKGREFLERVKNAAKEIKNPDFNFGLTVYKAIYSKNKIGCAVLLNFDGKVKINFFVTELLKKALKNRAGFFSSIYKLESYLNNKNLFIN